MDCTNDNNLPQQQQQQQPLTIETATAEFRAGVTACLRSWSALRTAVTNGWGGGAGISKEKAEFLRTHIYDNFDYAKRNAKPAMDIYDLEDALAIYMEEEFSIVLEEDSERQVAQLIMNMYENCGKGDFALSRHTIDAAMNAVAGTGANGNGNGNAVIQSNGELDEDSDDDDDKMMDTGAASIATAESNVAAVATFTNAQEYAADWLFGAPPGQEKRNNNNSNRPPPRQLGEAAPPQPEPEMDDDGFVTVKRR